MEAHCCDPSRRTCGGLQASDMARVMKTHRSVWLLLPVVILAGCGSTEKPHRSQTERRVLSEIRTAKQDIVHELEGGHYRNACGDFTTRTRAVLGTMMEDAEGSCAAGFEHYGMKLHEFGLEETAHLIDDKPAIRKLSAQQIRSSYRQLSSSPSSAALSRAQIKGDTATYKGSVLARYEQGRWRIEGIQPSKNHKSLASLEEACHLGRICELEIKALKDQT